MTLPVTSPIKVFTGLDGTPLENGYLYFGQANQNPETHPINVYWDSAKTQPAAQPVRTLAGYPSRNGTPSNVYIDGDFSCTIRDKNRQLVVTHPTSVDLQFYETLISDSTLAVDSIFDLQTAATGSGIHVSVRGYYSGQEQGGGLFYWDASKAKGLHDGGNVISPTVAWNGAKGAAHDAFLAGTGETDPGGSGCWVRILSSPIVQLANFGAAYDGANSDVQVLIKALSAGAGVYQVADGDQLIPRNASTIGTTVSDTHIVGVGVDAKLTLREDSATGVSEWFTVGGAGFKIKDTSIEFTKSQTGVSTEIMLQTHYGDIELSGLKIDGNTTLASSTQDRSVQLIKASTNANINTVSLMDSDISGVARVYTRDNPNTATHKILRFIGNIVRNVWRTALTINAPSGSVEDVLVGFNTFDTHAGIANGDTGMSGNNNAVGLTGVKGGRVIGNHVSGAYGAVVHVEENTNGISVVGNTSITANQGIGDAAYETLSNNVGGSQVTPFNCAYLGNVARSMDGVGDGFALHVGSGGAGLEYGLYNGNISSGFTNAFRTNTDSRSVLIKDNVLRGNTSSLTLNRASLLADGNLIDNCSSPITAARGGMVGAAHFVNLASARAAMSAFGSSTSGPLSITEWTWETDLFSTVNGAQNINIGPMPTRIFGVFSIAIVANSTNHRVAVFETSFDGATVTNTSKLNYGSGTITITGPANNGGNFAIAIGDAAAGGTSNVRIQVRFHGGVFVV